jgi:putative MATE family efflux protein
LASLFQALYGVTDMLIAGNFIGSRGISAINNAGQITLIAGNLATGLTTGGSILISQYFGNKDEPNRVETAGTVISVFTLTGLFAAILLYLLSRKMLIALHAPALEEAVAYLHICAFGLFFTFLYNALAAVIRAVGNSKIPSRILIAATFLNIVCDLIAMGPLQLGVAGAAYATVAAQIFSACAAFLSVKRQPEIFVFSRRTLHMAKDKVLTILKLGCPVAVQMTVAGISWLTITFLLNDYGVDVSAGSGISSKIKEISMLFIVAMSNSSATMIAQNLGAGQYNRSREIMYEAMKLSVLFSVVMILLVECFAPALVGAFTDSPAALEAGVLNLRIEMIGQIFYAIFMNYHSLAIGAGHPLFALGSTFTNCIAARIILALIFHHIWGLNGIFIACAIAPISSVPLGIIYDRSNIWKKSMVKEK